MKHILPITLVMAVSIGRAAPFAALAQQDTALPPAVAPVTAHPPVSVDSPQVSGRDSTAIQPTTDRDSPSGSFEAAWPEWLSWDALKWIIGIIAVGFVWWIGRPKREQTLRWIRSFLVRPAGGSHFTILIADLAGDDERKTQTCLLADAVRSNRGLRVVLHGRALGLPGVGHLDDEILKAESTGHAWLSRRNADVLVWGKVAGDDLLVRFLTPFGRGGNPTGQSKIGVELRLSREFHEAMGAQLTALALAGVAPVSQQRGRYLAKLLVPVIRKLTEFAGHVDDLDADQRGAILHSLGVANTVLGEQKGESHPLKVAVAALRRALQEWTQEQAPLEWAMTQNSLGNALATLGDREAGTARLNEAVVAFRAALQEHKQERVPLSWAMTQNNLGTALATLGEREAGTARLNEAVVAFRAALQEYKQERVPLQWATTQNNLGTVLRTLGEREADNTRLGEAVDAHRAALQEYKQERVPLQWASAQNNLGSALRTLGEREADTTRLGQAVDAFRAALRHYPQKRAPLLWAATQSNLGNALRALGEREADTTRLNEAVDAHRAALQVRTQERVPLDWATTQNNLGNALAALGEREAGTTRLNEAVAAYRAAKDVLRDANAEHYLGVAEEGLQRVERLIRERGG